MKSSYNKKTKSILFYSVLFSTEVQPVLASSSCDGPMKTSKLKEEDLMAMETQGFTDLPHKESSEMKEVEKSIIKEEDKLKLEEFKQESLNN